jgi:hypothetical protein
VHSAKIAVDVAQEHVDSQQQRPSPARGSKSDPRTPLGPLLTNAAAVPVAYFNLATQLRSGDMLEAAVSWYERAVLAAEHSNLDRMVVAALDGALGEAQRMLTGSPVDSRQQQLPPISTGSPYTRPPTHNQSERGQVPNIPEEDGLAYDPAYDVPTLGGDSAVASVAAWHRQRPKSAVSKLGGGYDTPPAPDKSTSVKEGGRSKLPTGVAAAVPGKSKRASGLGDSTGGTGDHEVEAIRDSLARQLMSLVQSRLNVEVQREQLSDVQRQEHLRQRRRDIAAVKQARSKELHTLIEMGFERQCTTEERLGVFESMLRAQNLQLNYGPSETPSDRYFEGMVVDVKRSLKANSDRDRCVIVRCRVNGTFDAEIIQSGELIINIQPSLIRVPPPPEEMLTASSLKTQPKETLYREAQRVQVLAPAGVKWFTGYIEKAEGRGLYKVEYLDGSFEEHVPAKRIRTCTGMEHNQGSSYEFSGATLLRTGGNQSTEADGEFRLAQPELFYVGQQVLMRFLHGVKWRMGTVMKVREDGQAYDVLLSGRQDVEKGVQAACIRHVESLLYGCGSEMAVGSRQPAPASPVAARPNNDMNRHGRKPSSPSRQSRASPSPGRPNQTTSNLKAIKSGRVSLNHVQSETRTRISDADGGGHIPPAPAARGGAASQQESSAIALRDRYAQEMHRGAAMLNASAAERKLARLVRQEKIRVSSAVKIQALIRGFLARTSATVQLRVSRHRASLIVEEANLTRGVNELLDRYAEALSLAVSKEADREVVSNVVVEQLPPVQQQQLTMQRSQSSQQGDEGIEERLNHIREAVTDESRQHALSMEKMRSELVAIHEDQLAHQRKELEGVLAREIRALSQAMTDAVNTRQIANAAPATVEHVPPSKASSPPKEASIGPVSPAGITLPLTAAAAAKESSEPDVQVLGESDQLTYAMDVAAVAHSMEHMKDAYLSVWGNSSVPHTEVVSLVASSTVEYSVVEAAVDNELLMSMHALNDGEDFKSVHWMTFVKDASPDPFYQLKVRLSPDSAKAAKLKLPGLKISGICKSHKAVNVTMNEQTKFEICATSLRLDDLVHRMLSLWNAHVAWASQGILISIALHKNLQRLAQQHGAFSTNASLTLPPTGCISDRFSLLADLSSIREEYFEAKAQYDSTVTEVLNEMRLLLLMWGYFPKPTGEAEEDCAATLMAFSSGLADLASSVFQPFREFIAFGGEVSAGPVDAAIFNEHLRAKYEGEGDCSVNTLLQKQFMDFSAALSVGAIFERLCLSPIMLASLQTWAHAFGHADMFNWSDWCRQNREWAALAIVSDTLDPRDVVIMFVLMLCYIFVSCRVVRTVVMKTLRPLSGPCLAISAAWFRPQKLPSSPRPGIRSSWRLAT